MNIFTEIRFESAHLLPRVPPGHKCGRLHGHSYKVLIYVSGQPDPETGWVMDFGDVRKAAEPLRQRLDHHYLNEIPGLENPTSENLAKYIWNDLVNEIPISKVIVQETCTSGCEYSES